MKALSLKEKKRKCSKCGSSPVDDPTVKLHRFPQPNKANKSRCELWAKFCFPDEAWKSPKFQNKLFTEHKMLCDKHFKSTSFEKEQRLAKCSVPENEFEEKSSKEDGPIELEVVLVKDEPEDESNIQEHSIITRSQKRQRTSAQNDEKNNSTNTIAGGQPLKHKLAKVDDSPKKTQQRKVKHAEKKDATLKTTDKWNEIEEMSQKEFDENFSEWFGKTFERNDDCELYGKLLTKKLRTYTVHERNIVMFKIDGLLIKHPPGFDTSSHSYTNTSTDDIDEKSDETISKDTKSSLTLKSAIELNSNGSDKAAITSPPSKIKRVKKGQLSHAVQISTQSDETTSIATQVTSTSMPLLSPEKIAYEIMKQVTNKSTNQPAKVTSSTNKPDIATSTSLQATSKYQLVRVTSSIPDQPVKVTSISDHIYTPQAKSNSMPSHLPLQITIPQTKVGPLVESKFAASSTHPKGKIVIVKSKSGKYVPSSQPPILITVPSVHGPTSSKQTNMNSLEQLSSIAATQDSYDINVVSHEVIL